MPIGRVFADRLRAVKDMIQVAPRPDDVARTEPRGKEQRDEEEQQPLETGDAVLELTAEGHRPTGVGEMVDHDQYHHADGDGGPEYDGDQPADGDGGGVAGQRKAKHGGNDTGDTDTERLGGVASRGSGIGGESRGSGCSVGAHLLKA